MKDRVIHSNFNLMRISYGEKKNEADIMFEEIITNEFQKLWNDSQPQIWKVQKIPVRINKKKSTLGTP